MLEKILLLWGMLAGLVLFFGILIAIIKSKSNKKRITFKDLAKQDKNKKYR